MSVHFYTGKWIAMAWEWICISLNSWMVVLMVLVQFCTVSHVPGAKGGSGDPNFLDL
jgi:hypothetical protein